MLRPGRSRYAPRVDEGPTEERVFVPLAEGRSHEPQRDQSDGHGPDGEGGNRTQEGPPAQPPAHVRDLLFEEDSRHREAPADSRAHRHQDDDGLSPVRVRGFARSPGAGGRPVPGGQSVAFSLGPDFYPAPPIRIEFWTRLL